MKQLKYENFDINCAPYLDMWTVCLIVYLMSGQNLFLVENKFAGTWYFRCLKQDN